MFPFGLIKTPDPVSVDWNGNLVDNVRSGSPCLAKLKFDADGEKYASDNTGNYGASYKTWLTLGSVSQVWVERTINSGTLAFDNIGDGRVSMTTDRELGIIRTTSGTDTANVTVDFYDAASGGNLLASAAASFQATRT